MRQILPHFLFPKIAQKSCRKPTLDKFDFLLYNVMVVKNILTFQEDLI